VQKYDTGIAMTPNNENTGNHPGLFGERSDGDDEEDTNDATTNVRSSSEDKDDNHNDDDKETTREEPTSNNKETQTLSPFELSDIKSRLYMSSKFDAELFGEPQDDEQQDDAEDTTTQDDGLPCSPLPLDEEAEVSVIPKGDAGLFGESEGDDAVVAPSPLAIRPQNNQVQAFIHSNVSVTNIAVADEFIVAHPIPDEQAIVHAALHSFQVEDQAAHTIRGNDSSHKNNMKFMLLAMAFLIVGLVVGVAVGFGVDSQAGNASSSSITQAAPTTAPAPGAVPSILAANGSLGEWVFCSASSQCANGCCSTRYSVSDGRLKCTPVGGYRPDMCIPPAPEVDWYLDDWAFCNTSAQCANGCCSREFSTSDGKLKCTPIAAFDPHICVSSYSNSSFPTSSPLDGLNDTETSVENQPLYVGRYIWTWSPTNDKNDTNLSFSVAFSGWVDIYEALRASESVYSVLQGEKYISIGGGNENGYWNQSALALLNDAIVQGDLKFYEGIVYDIEEGDTGLLSSFRDSFAIAKSHGFKVIVTISHSAPYGFADASELMQGFFVETNIDALSPQLYTTGMEGSNDYSEGNDVAWTDYYNATPAIVPSLVNGGIYFTDAQEYFATNHDIHIQGYIQWTQD
jgi:hypothetical protein